MNVDYKIRKAEGGYILTDADGAEYVVNGFEAACKWLLFQIEGRGPTFSGDRYGDIVFIRQKPERE